jgi:hypothetical protein
MSSSTGEKLANESLVQVCEASEKGTPRTQSTDDVSRTELLSQEEERRLIRKIDIQ